MGVLAEIFLDRILRPCMLHITRESMHMAKVAFPSLDYHVSTYTNFLLVGLCHDFGPPSRTNKFSAIIGDGSSWSGWPRFPDFVKSSTTLCQKCFTSWSTSTILGREI